MKKFLTFLLIATLAVIGLTQQTAYAADDDLIDIYPYNDMGALTGVDLMPGHTFVGDSNWDIIFNGYRYNVVGGNVRYASEANDGEGFFYDEDANDFIEAIELPTLPWNAFGSLYINDTDLEFILDPVSDAANASRSDFSGVLHRMYTYWDENGVIQMFEDHISTYLIVNENYDAEATTPHDPLTADYRMATEAEKTAYTADPVPFPQMRNVPIRIMRDAVDTDGYVIEPLQLYGWKNADLAAEVDEADWSVLLDTNPNQVVIPAGWTVFSTGTRDRGFVSAEEVNHVAWLKTLPASIAEGDDEALVTTYVTPEPTFSGTLSAALDDDSSVAGVQTLVGKNVVFELPNTLKATWVNMFDATGNIQNKVEELDYTVELFEEGNLLETVTFTWDGTVYTPDKAITSFIDSTDINNRYELKYHVVAPDAQMLDVDVQVAVGYYPPKFSNVEPRFVQEDMFVDLLGEITAQNGYDVDVTDDIEISYPDSLNPYYPQPGMYDIDFEVTYNHFTAAVPHSLTIDGVVATFDKADINSTTINGYPFSDSQRFIVFTDTDIYRAAMASGSGWGTVMTIIAADGTLKERYDRFNWGFVSADGTTGIGDATLFAAWAAAIELGEGEYGLASHGSASAGPIRTANLSFGDPVVIDLGVDEVNDYVTSTTSYLLTVDDTTAPSGIVVNNDYSITTDQFTDADAAILANVVAIDNYDASKDLTMYVEDDGGLKLNTVGSYTVAVGIEDAMGNYTTVSFDVNVVAAKVSTAALDAEIATLEATVAALQTALEAADAADKATLLASIATLQGLVDTLEAELATLETALDTQSDAIDAIEASLVETDSGGCGKEATAARIAGLSIVSITFLSTIAFFLTKKRY